MHDYPVLVMRIKALMIDILFLLFAMMLVAQVFGLFSHVPDGVRLGVFVLLFCLYDPIMTSFFGGTLGHMAVGIRVRRENAETVNISFLAALMRFIIKSSLGWISLLTVTGNRRKRAIHDMLSGSLVTFK